MKDTYNKLEELDKEIGSIDKTTTLFKKLQSVELDPKEEIIQDPAILSAIIEGKEFKMLSAGNISVCSGAPKSKKTFHLSGVASACVLNEGLNSDTKEPKLIMNMYASLPSDKTTVLYFDTEQSKYHAQKVNKRILKMAGLEYSENFKYYKLRGLTGAECLELIVFAIEHYKTVGMVCIDGIADLLSTGINNEEEANKLILRFMDITERYGVHITSVLHTNKAKEGQVGTLSGWIGTQILKKVELAIRVEKDKENPNVSHVLVTDSRDLCFDTYSFEVDGEGIPHAIKGLYKKTLDISKVLNNEQIANILSRVEEFGELNKTDFLYRLSLELKEFEKLNPDVKINPTVRNVKDFFNQYLMYNSVIEELKKGTKKIIQLNKSHKIFKDTTQQILEM